MALPPSGSPGAKRFDRLLKLHCEFESASGSSLDLLFQRRRVPGAGWASGAPGEVGRSDAALGLQVSAHPIASLEDFRRPPHTPRPWPDSADLLRASTALCKKAGIPLADVRGNITSHRARDEDSVRSGDDSPFRKAIVGAIAVAKIVELPRLGCCEPAANNILIDEDFNGTEVASKIARIGIGLCKLQGTDFRIVLCRR